MRDRRTVQTRGKEARWRGRLSVRSAADAGPARTACSPKRSGRRQYRHVPVNVTPPAPILGSYRVRQAALSLLHVSLLTNVTLVTGLPVRLATPLAKAPLHARELRGDLRIQQGRDRARKARSRPIRPAQGGRATCPLTPHSLSIGSATRYQNRAPERRATEAVRTFTLWRALYNPTVLLLALNFLGIATGSGMLIFIPQIIKSLGSYSNMTVGWLTIPYICGAIAMVVWGRISDRMSVPA